MALITTNAFKNGHNNSSLKNYLDLICKLRMFYENFYIKIPRLRDEVADEDVSTIAKWAKEKKEVDTLYILIFYFDNVI